MRPHASSRAKRSLPLAALATAALLVVLAVSAAAPGAALACEKARKSSSKLSKQEARSALRCLINKGRRNRSLRRLGPNDSLALAAQRHSRVMERKRCLSHQCPGEDSLGTRVRRAGYLKGAKSYRYGENIAGGAHASPRRVYKMWMASPAHRSQILGPYEHLGIGFKSSRRRVYMTLDFGSRRG